MSTQEFKVTSPDDLNSLVVSVEPEIVFDLFYKHFSQTVYRFIVRWLNNHNCKDPNDHGNDVNQQTFIEVHKEFCSYFDKRKEPAFSNPKGWLYSIAITKAFHHFKKDCGKNNIEVDFSQQKNDNEDDFDKFLNNLINEESINSSRCGSVAASLEAKQALNSIYKYISGLPTIKQAAFILRINGATHGEIGEALEMTESAASRMVNRIFFEIKRRFNPTDGGM
jgi:RNA polymerase sigma factor (sigma-70 family)